MVDFIDSGLRQNDVFEGFARGSKDSKNWRYAKEHHLTIVTKDADFSDLAIVNGSPPRVIHIKFGNMKMREFHQSMSKIWSEACLLSSQYKLVRVYKERFECIE